MEHERFKELWYSDELTEVSDETDDGYRHGVYKWTVYQYGNTFWEASYTVSGNGEEHGIRDGYFDLRRVYPQKKVSVETIYLGEPPLTKTRYFSKPVEVEAVQFPGVPSLDLMNLVGNQEEYDDLEFFEKWLEANKGSATCKYRGKEELIIDYGQTSVSAVIGNYLVKEPGNPIYVLTPSEFNARFQSQSE